MTDGATPQSTTDAIARFRARLTRRRTEAGMSSEDLAGAAQLSRVYISNLERGRYTNPSLMTLTAIAGGLDIPVADLLPAASDPEDEEALEKRMTKRSNGCHWPLRYPITATLKRGHGRRCLAGQLSTSGIAEPCTCAPIAWETPWPPVPQPEGEKS